MYTRHVSVHMYIVAYVRSMGCGMKGYPLVTEKKNPRIYPSPENSASLQGCWLLIMRALDMLCLLTVNARMRSTGVQDTFKGVGSLPGTKKKNTIIKIARLVAFTICQT